MDYLDKNNIYKPKSITLDFEDYQRLLDRIKDEENWENQLLEMVTKKELVYIKNSKNPDYTGFIKLDKLSKRTNSNTWEIIE